MFRLHRVYISRIDRGYMTDAGWACTLSVPKFRGQEVRKLIKRRRNRTLCGFGPGLRLIRST